MLTIDNGFVQMIYVIIGQYHIHVRTTGWKSKITFTAYWFIDRPLNEAVAIFLLPLATATFGASLVKFAMAGGRENDPTNWSLAVD